MKWFSTQLVPVPSAALFLACMLAPTALKAQRNYGPAGFFPGGMVSGTVVDAEGTPQMGALVQILLPDASLVASALTDVHGRYRLSDLNPGNYRVRVSAALFLPAVRQRLLISTGSRSVVNLTLSTVLATSQWLPATKRTSADAEDDWMWTLRSSTMRPVLRLAGDDRETSLNVSSSSSESRVMRTQGRLAMHQNDGGFARGGAHQVLSLERRNGDRSNSFIRADISGPRTPFPVAPSADLSAGWQHWMAAGMVSRSTLTYSSHPEVLGPHSASGLQTAVLRNAERMELGDAIRIDAGSVLREVNLAGNAVVMEPFFRLAVRPSDGVVIAYALSHSRGTESLDDLDRIDPPMPIATSRDGRLRLDQAHHQALSVSHRTIKDGSVQMAVYRDSMHHPVISGTGVLSGAEANSISSLTDPTTQSFRVGVRNFGGSGVRFELQQPITSAVALRASYSSGHALISETGPHASLSEVIEGLQDQKADTATLALEAHSVRTGTRVHAGYRWQPANTLTAVDSFESTEDSAYLHCKARQSLRAIRFLPEGLEAVIDVQNLLAEGYRPFLSQDGHTLYLAQAPRVLQAGLSLTF